MQDIVSSGPHTLGSGVFVLSLEVIRAGTQSSTLSMHLTTYSRPNCCSRWLVTECNSFRPVLPISCVIFDNPQSEKKSKELTWAKRRECPKRLRGSRGPLLCSPIGSAQQQNKFTDSRILPGLLDEANASDTQFAVQLQHFLQFDTDFLSNDAFHALFPQRSVPPNSQRHIH